jgi:hypothetical protein
MMGAGRHRIGEKGKILKGGGEGKRFKRLNIYLKGRRVNN